MSTNTRRRRERATDAQIAAAYGITSKQAGQWRRSGARITRLPDGRLAEWSPAYPDAPAAVRRAGGRAGR